MIAGKLFLVGVALAAGAALAAPREIVFSQSAPAVDVWDFVEVTIRVTAPDVSNPFTDASVAGDFGPAGSANRLKVEGFSDSPDGSLYRIRFMPMAAGDYSYSVTYRQSAFEKTFTGTFRAADAHRRGAIRVDPAYPWHFIWAGTGEHYFFNGTTSFWLMGWRDERIIRSSLDRLHRLKINRARVLLSGRTGTMYGEPVMNTEAFSI